MQKINKMFTPTSIGLKISDIDVELSQSLQRLVLTISMFSYAYFMSDNDYQKFLGNSELALNLVVTYLIYSIANIAVVYYRPGVFVVRRLISIVSDTCVCTVVLSYGNHEALPVYAVLVSVAMGHGIRFGANYLVVAVFMAVLGVITSVIYNPYLREELYTSLTLLIVLLVIPIYAFILLKKLRSARDNAEIMDRKKSKFLARASHDLRQPIHAIGLLSSGLENTKLSVAQKNAVFEISDLVDRSRDLFQSVLDLSVIEAGGMKASYEAVSLSSIFNEVAKQNEIFAKRSGIDIRIVNSSKVIFTDRIMLVTILQNLVSNSIKYASGKKILIGARISGKKLRIWVGDRGEGIKAQQLNQITEEFYRGENVTALPESGTGLGLSIVSRLASLMSLRIYIRSQLTHGTSVEISDFDILDVNIAQEPKAKSTAVQHLNGMRVLLIEDDPRTLEATENLLSHWGCNVTAFDHFPTKLESGYKPDAIVTDFDLGDDGMLSDHQKNLQNLIGDSSRIVVISGIEEKVIRSKMKRTGHTILSKPVRPAQLRSFLMACKSQS